MIVGVELPSNGSSLLLHILVKVEQILGHQMQEMLQIGHLPYVPVVHYTKSKPHPFDMCYTHCLDWSGEVIGGHACAWSGWWVWMGAATGQLIIG